MTTATVASIHLTGINESRKKCGLPALSLVEVEREFADLDRSPPRAKVGPPRTNQAAIDSMHAAIVAKLNSTLPSSRTPIGARQASPAPANNRAVDWAQIAETMNCDRGLATPPRRAR